MGIYKGTDCVAGVVASTYKGIYDEYVTYHQGDIIRSSAGTYAHYYVARQDTTGNTFNNVNYWTQIDNDRSVIFSEVSNNINYPIGLTNSDISGSSYGGYVHFTLQNSPTINASTGIINAPGGMTTLTQAVTDDSNKVATTAFVKAWFQAHIKVVSTAPATIENDVLYIVL